MANGSSDLSRILHTGTRRLAEGIAACWVEKRMPARGQPALSADCLAWAKARLSVMLRPHVQAAQVLVSRIRALEDRGQIRIIVGGRPFNGVADLWKTSGADGTYLANALIGKEMSA